MKFQRHTIPHFKALDPLFWPQAWALTLRVTFFEIRQKEPVAFFMHLLFLNSFKMEKSWKGLPEFELSIKSFQSLFSTNWATSPAWLKVDNSRILLEEWIQPLKSQIARNVTILSSFFFFENPGITKKLGHLWNLWTKIYGSDFTRSLWHLHLSLPSLASLSFWLTKASPLSMVSVATLILFLDLLCLLVL